MKQILILPVSLLFILCFSCSKERYENYQFEGVLLHSVTNQPLANQNIRMTLITTTYGPKDVEFPNGIPINNSTTFNSITGSDGKFSFPFRARGQWKYEINLISSSYTVNYGRRGGKIIYGDPLNNPVDRWQYYDTIYAERPGNFRVHIKNINTTNHNDTLFLLWSGGIYSAFFGPAVDTTVNYSAPAEWDPNIPVYWAHKTADTIISRKDVLQINPVTTTDYNIYY